MPNIHLDLWTNCPDGVLSLKSTIHNKSADLATCAKIMPQLSRTLMYFDLEGIMKNITLFFSKSVKILNPPLFFDQLAHCAAFLDCPPHN